MSSTQEITSLLEAASQGDTDALTRLLPAVYEELRELADRHLRRERANHTLQATALVHEAYLQLIDQRDMQWKSRAHFMAIAATAMRRILLNHARHHGRHK